MNSADVSGPTVVVAAVGLVFVLGAVVLSALLVFDLGVLSWAAALQSQGVTELLYVLALGFPILGVVVVLVSLVVYWMYHDSRPDALVGENPTHPSFVSHRPLEARAADKLDHATEAQYTFYPSPMDDDLRQLLRSGALRAIQTSRGFNESRARRAVEDGTWTDDPVAAAFLASEPQYPLRERLAGALDPGWAYRRRLRRTLDAIEHAEHSTDEASHQPTTPVGVEESKPEVSQ